MPKKIAKRPRKPAALASTPQSLVPHLKLRTVRVVESRSKLTLVNNKFPDNLQVSADVAIGVSDDRTHLLGSVTATVQSPEAAEPQSNIEIMVTVQCIFDSPPLPDMPLVSDDEKQSINATVMLIAWPYVRQHVHAATASMAIPPFTVPLFQVGAVTIHARRDIKQ